MLFGNFPLLPDSACEQALQVDYLFYFISATTGAATVLVYVLSRLPLRQISSRGEMTRRLEFSGRTSSNSFGLLCRSLSFWPCSFGA